MAVSITGTRTSTLFDDKDGDGQFDSGDIITTRIRITVGPGDDAEGVTVNATTNGLTIDAFDSNAVQVTPIAFDDLMPSITGNTPMTFTAAQLLGNDIDPDGAEINITITGVSNATNGAIVNNGNGTFTFTPTTGYVGTASFQYTIADEDGLAGVSTGIVTFNVTDPVWYVNNGTGSDITGDGSWAKPFATLAPLTTGGSADALDNADDTIFVHNLGTYDNVTLVLEAGQKLFGDGHAFSVNGIDIGAADTNNTTLDHTATAITLSSNNTIMGVTINGTAGSIGAVGIDDGGNDVGNLVIDKSSITGAGKAIDIDQGGNLNIDLDALSSGSSATQGIHLQGVTGTFNAASGIIQQSAGTAVLIGASGGGTANSGGNVNFTFGGSISNTGTSSVEIQDRTGGTVTFSGGITDGNIAAGQTGIIVDGSAGTINFTGQTFIGAGGGAGNGVTLTNNSGTINFNPTGQGFDISVASGTGLVFTGGGTLNITGTQNSVTTTTGQVLNLANGTMGTSGIAFSNLTGGTVASGNAININNLDAAGSGVFSGGAVTIAGTAGVGADAINITGSNSTFNFASATIGSTAAGNFVAGDGIEINGTTPNTNGAVTFGSVSINGVTGVGVNIVGATNAVNINGGNIGGTNDSGGDGVFVNGGTGAVTVAASVTQSTGANNVVDVANHSGGAITFSGAITAAVGGGGIRLVNNTGGNIDFTGNTTLNVGAQTGITFTNTGATGANVTFSEGTLDLDTTSGIGINATSTTIGAGSLTISGGDNFITATTGRAINIEGVTTNITLEQVNATGGSTTAVFLKNTGSGGQFVVTGTGSTQGSGGTISNIGGADMGSAGAAATGGTGIYLENVSNVSLSNMIIGASGGTMTNFGIRGESVNNFTLTDSEFRGTFGTNTSLDEDIIRFGTGGASTGLTGTAVFQGNVIGVNGTGNGALEAGLSVYVYGNNTLNLTIKDSASDQAVFGHNYGGTAANNYNDGTGTDGFLLESGGTSNVSVTVTGVQFTGSRGDLMQVASTGSAVQNISISGNTFHNTQETTLSGGAGVAITGSLNNSNITYNIDGNSFKGTQGASIFSMFNGSSGTVNGIVNNNTFGTANGVADNARANYGSAFGGAFFGGIDSKFAGTGTINYALRISNNTIRDSGSDGSIMLRSAAQDTQGTARLEATISNNNISEARANVAAGIYAQVANTGNAGHMGLNISNNSINMSGAVGDGVYIDNGNSANGAAYFPGYAGPSNPTPSAFTSYLTGKGNSFIAGNGSGGGGANYNAGGTMSGQNFVLGVPAMALDPDAGKSWEELDVSPVTAPPRDADVPAGTEGSGSAGGGTGGSGGGSGFGEGSGDTGTGGGAAPSGPPADDGILTPAELGALVEAAIQRWIDAGATPAQVDAMRAVQFGIVDMAGIYVGYSTHGVVNIDVDGAGYGWFVDSTPGEDSEFSGSGSSLSAVAGGGAAGKLDLLTVVMHELGHQIGLEDEYSASEASELMYGYVNAGERRLPDQGEAAGATPGSVGSTAYAIAPVSIGTIPAGKTVDILIKSTITPQTDGFLVNPVNTATISGNGFNQVIQETITLDGLSLGDLVFLDVNKDGDFDSGTDSGIVGVVVDLYADTNDSGGWDSGDAFLGTTTTIAGGLYSFAGLAPGDYIVVVKASNFDSGQALAGRVSVAGGTGPDDNINNDDNGLTGIAGLGVAVASQKITLSAGAEPIDDGDSDPDTNRSLDFGFFAANQAPVIGAVTGDTGTFTENGAAVNIDSGGNATVTDSDSANFDGGSLTISMNGSNGDSIVFGGGVALDGNNKVSVGATEIGTLSTNGNNIVIALNSSANAANIQTLIRGLQFTSSGDTPTAGERTITLTLVDGDGNDGGLGNDTGTASATITVVAVSDAPEGADRTGSGLYDSAGAAYAFTVADFATGFSDPNDSPANTFSGVRITTLPSASAGTIYFDSNLSDAVPAVAIAAGDTFTAQDLTDGKLTFVGAPNSGGTAMSFTFQVIDNGSTANGGVVMDSTPNTFSATVLASNAAPVLDLDGDDSNTVGTGFASSYTEGGAAAAIGDVDVTIGDGDSGDDIVSATITITNAVAGDILNVGTLPAAVTVDPTSTATVVKLVAAPGTSRADFEAAIEAITFSNTGDNPTDDGSNASRSISVVVNDGNADSNVATATVSVTDDDSDAPSGTSSTITALEDSFRLIQASDLGFSDPDGTFASVTISAVTGGGIYFDSDGSAGAGVPVLETLPATYTAQDLIDGKVSFRADPNANGSGIGSITFAVTDDDGNVDSSPNVLTVDVTPVNDVPVLDTSSGDTAYTEDGAPAAIDGAITVTDIDDLVVAGQVQITGNASAGDLLVFVNNDSTAFGDIAIEAGSSDTVLNLRSASGTATLAQWENALRAVTFQTVSDTPSTAPRTISFVVNDGTGFSTFETKTVTVTAVNDAPVLDLNGAAAGTGAALSFSEGDGVTPIAPDATVADADSADFAGGTLVVDLTTLGTGDYLSIVAGNGITIDPGAQKISFNGVEIASYAITNLAATYTYTFNAAADAAAVQALVRQVSFANQNDNQLSGDRTVTFTLSDGGGGTANVVSATVSVTAVDDAAIAQDDAVATAENAVGTGSLFADNGSGLDSDVDGGSFSVTQITVGGQDYAPGAVIDLPSGAKLVVNADGTYSYDPNGKFNRLTDNSSGAVNTSAVGDTFSYTVTGGDTATVTVTVNGVAGPGDWLMGDGTDNIITGTPQGDFFFVTQGGDDDLSGLGGNDVFFFGGAMTSDDDVDGGEGADQIALQGDYSGGLVFGTEVTSIESIAILPGNDARFGDTSGTLYDYDVTTVDENVAAGVQLVIDANRLRMDEDFTFDGSAETDGSFFIYGGRGTDNLTGGAGNDVFLFGAGGQWGSTDVIDGGPGGKDQLALRGDYSITFGATQLVGIVSIGLLSAYDTRFGALGERYDYSLTMSDGNLTAGVEMTIDGAKLREDETMSFNGSAETDGSFRVFGGRGMDVIQGSQNADVIVGRGRGDTLYGNGGNDVFRYDSITDSNPIERDGIQDFNSGDVIDLLRIDANTLVAGDQAFSFIGNAAFSSTAGELRFENISLGGPVWLVQGDVDGNGVSDFEVVLIISPADPITSSDFIL